MEENGDLTMKRKRRSFDTQTASVCAQIDNQQDFTVHKVASKLGTASVNVEHNMVEESDESSDESDSVSSWIDDTDIPISLWFEQCINRKVVDMSDKVKSNLGTNNMISRQFESDISSLKEIDEDKFKESDDISHTLNMSETVSEEIEKDCPSRKEMDEE